MIYCTLFNSNYLDRGIVMINSLLAVDKQAKIYVLAMDKICEEILNKIYNSVIVISINDFEDDDLKKVKDNRSIAEYSWSCTGKLIKYVLEKYNESICTYIDADMRFYSNPSVLIREMEHASCSVQVVPHRFPENRRGRRREKASGRICVQFNTFTKANESLHLLDNWIDQCINNCSVENVGDQLYTDPWCELPFVNVSNNIGAGIAPWNSTRYIADKSNMYIIMDRYSQKKDKMVFFHFQNLTFPSDDQAVVEPLLQYWVLDKKWISFIYSQYLQEIADTREMLLNLFSFCPVVRKYVSDEYYKDRTMKDRLEEFIKISIDEKIERISNKIRRKVRKKRAIFYLNNSTQGGLL